MPPSSVNDSARAMMARIAEFRDDRSGMLLDTGTASAYAVTTNEGVQLPTPADGTSVSFIPANTNNSGVTLAVDGGTPFPIQTMSGSGIGSGFMKAGTPYDVVFKTSASAWLIKNLFSQPISNITYGQIQNVSASRLLGNPTGAPASVSEISLGTALSFTGSVLNGVAQTAFVPNIQVFTSGSSLTYTTPTNGGNLPLYLSVRMAGGGGGGGAVSTNNGQNGGDTSFSGWTAIHGAGGVTNNGAGGTGGSGGTNGTGTLLRRITGQAGTAGSGAAVPQGGPGGSSPLGGGGPAQAASNGLNAVANTGSGGSGGNSGAASGGGGGAGEYVEFIISSPAATYTYTVGTGGNGGAAGTQAGGNGAAGRIEVIAYWQ